MDRGGFILSRGVTHASEQESKAVAALIEKLPLHPASLAGDSGYSDGRLRQLLEERNITACIPIHTRHATSMVSTSEFVYHGGHLVCPEGKNPAPGAVSTILSLPKGGPTSMWRGRRTASPVRSRRPASRRSRNGGTSP